MSLFNQMIFLPQSIVSLSEATGQSTFLSPELSSS